MREFYINERVQVCKEEDIPAEKVNKTVLMHIGRKATVIDRYSLDGDDFIYILKFDGEEIPSVTAFSADMLEYLPPCEYELKVEKKGDKLFLRLFENGEMVNHSYGKLYSDTKEGFATAILCAAKILHSYITNPNYIKE